MTNARNLFHYFKKFHKYFSSRFEPFTKHIFLYLVAQRRGEFVITSVHSDRWNIANIATIFAHEVALVCWYCQLSRSYYKQSINIPTRCQSTLLFYIPIFIVFDFSGEYSRFVVNHIHTYLCSVQMKPRYVPFTYSEEFHPHITLCIDSNNRFPLLRSIPCETSGE